MLCHLVSVVFVNPLSFSCFSNAFRQPPHPTSQLCRQADAAGPAESYRLCPGFPHGRRRRVTKASQKMWSLFLILLTVASMCPHKNKHYSGHQNNFKEHGRRRFGRGLNSPLCTFWWHKDAVGPHYRCFCSQKTLLIILIPNPPQQWVWNECRNTIYLWSLSYTKETCILT